MLSADEAAHVRALLRADAERCYRDYEEMLNTDTQGNRRDPQRDGLARELARINLTLATYTQWYWKIDLHNLLHFLSLRADPHAQYEIRAYAEAMLATVARWVPITHRAFLDYRLGATLISAPAMRVIRRLVRGEQVNQAESGLSQREWRELLAALERNG